MRQLSQRTEQSIDSAPSCLRIHHNPRSNLPTTPTSTIPSICPAWRRPVKLSAYTIQACFLPLGYSRECIRIALLPRQGNDLQNVRLKMQPCEIDWTGGFQVPLLCKAWLRRTFTWPWRKLSSYASFFCKCCTFGMRSGLSSRSTAEPVFPAALPALSRSMVE